MATEKKAPVKKAPVEKSPAKKTAAKKTAPKKSQDFSIKESAEKVVNIYLGVIGTGMDSIKDFRENSRKDSEKRMKDLEKRGAKLRKVLNKRVDDFEVPGVVEDAKTQVSKIQDQVEEAVEKVKEKLSIKKAA